MARKRSYADLEAELARVSHERACLASALAYVVRDTMPDAKASYYPDETDPQSERADVYLYDVRTSHGGVVLRTTDMPGQALRVDVDTLDGWRARLARIERAGDCLPEREACERLNRARSDLLAGQHEGKPA